MSSYWTSFSPSRESDYYRPSVTLNLDRPPRPGPRQPDCWRPTQRIPSSHITTRQDELSGSPNTNDGKQKAKPSILTSPIKEATSPSYEEAIGYPKAKNEVKKPKVKPPKLPNANKEPLGQLRGGFSGRLDDSNRLEPQLDQVPSAQGGGKSAPSLKTDSKAETCKVKPPKLPNPNLQPLGKRQMGVINSVLRVEEPKSKATKVNEVKGDQLTTTEAEPLNTGPEIKLEEMDEIWQTVIPTTDDNLTSTPENNERPPCRRLPYPRNLSSTEPQWSRTSLSSLPPATTETRASSPSSTKVVQSQGLVSNNRRKLDFGNRVDQCLLKMDKWADAWLSNALTDEDPSPDTDNAWNSFEYCLGMPDILEEGEIIEYEEAPRHVLPVEVKVTGSDRQIVGTKRKRERDEAESTVTQQSLVSKSWAEQRGMMLNLAPMVAQPENKTLWNTNENGERAPGSVDDDTSWTNIRESRPAEFRSSSSPEDQKMKIVRIPSAATLREEARRKLM